MTGRVEDFRNDVIIRWGNASLSVDRFGQRTDFRNVLNPAQAVIANMNKPTAHDILSKVVATPRMFRKYTPDRGLFVVRPYSHQEGNGFKVVEAKGQSIRLQEGWQYATEFIRTDAEYRVWFIGDRTIRARRTRTDEQQCETFPRFPCRSKWGYVFCKEMPQGLHNQTIKAAKAIGLDCGAADILLANGTWYFLELNSAPSADLGILQRWMRESIRSVCYKKLGV
jgi:glutathione synthase/RimK-type ligase-like ATP-grasp enzyme